MTSQPTDQKLAAEYLLGSDEALDQLIERYLDRIYAFTHRITQNSADARDITQEVLVKVWRKIGSYDSNYAFSTWVFTIAKNSSFDFLRKKKQAVFSDFTNALGENLLEESLEDNSPLLEIVADRKLDKDHLEKVLTKLPIEYRTILSLRYGEGFTLTEIAKIMGKPINTTKSQSRRALLELRKLLTS